MGYNILIQGLHSKNAFAKFCSIASEGDEALWWAMFADASLLRCFTPGGG